MSTPLRSIRDGWDRAAREDAMFNIVTLPQYQGGTWPKGEFFEHGQIEIDAMAKYLDEHDFRKDLPRDTALDFGCGVGRLTQALAGEYAHVTGCDVSGEMIKLAREYNAHGQRVHYVQTGAQLLSTFTRRSFDFIYSRIVLQHMPPNLQRGYIGEFVQLLHHGGLACFQIPDGPTYEHPNDWLSMYGVPRADVEVWVERAGGVLLDVEHLEDASPQWAALRYTVTA